MVENVSFKRRLREEENSGFADFFKELFKTGRSVQNEDRRSGLFVRFSFFPQRPWSASFTLSLTNSESCAIISSRCFILSFLLLNFFEEGW